MENKHTPGPWILNTQHASYDGVGNLRSILGGRHAKQCICLLGEADPEEKQANANVLAAGPEMLELLQWITKATNCPEIGLRCDKLIKKIIL